MTYVNYSLPRCEATGKVCYRKKDALSKRNYRTKGKRTRKNHSRPSFLRVYHCPHCNAWHLTHTK